MNKVAFITGITGQDGTYLSELLLKKGYSVWGMVRRASNSGAIARIKKLTDGRVNLRYGDMTDPVSIRKILTECKPDEVYNLAAQSHVRVSFDVPEYTAKVNAVGVVDLLDAITSIVPEARFYQASTSEMFGHSTPPQDENTSFKPCSPYGSAKLHAYWHVKNIRDSFSLFASNGILFNHESERRGLNFVTRKITSTVAKIKLGIENKLSLGNLDAKRDWGHAEDYVRAMYLMLQHDVPDDYVISTGKANTVRSFLENTLKCAGIKFIVSHDSSKPEDPVGIQYINEDNGNIIVDIDPRFYRPVEVNYLCGKPDRARDILGWETIISFENLIERMYKNDFDIYSSGLGD